MTPSPDFLRGVRAGLAAAAKAFECAGGKCSGDTSKCGYADCDPWVAARIRAIDPTTVGGDHG